MLDYVDRIYIHENYDNYEYIDQLIEKQKEYKNLSIEFICDAFDVSHILLKSYQGIIGIINK